MAEARRFGLTPQLDIQQILREAQHRWLRPAEICEILRNHTHFQIAPEPANQPPSGSLFLFDRKVLRYFRKDGHNWRKKKDGKTVKEAHERLKSGSVDVLHCYYAHGASNPNFQRRSYWMLEEDFMNMVLVHYREVKDKKETYGRTRDNDEFAQGSYLESPVGSNSVTNYSPATSLGTDVESRNSQLTSEFEDIDSDKSQASSGYHPFSEFGRFSEQSLTNYCQVSTNSNVLPHNNCGQQIQRPLVPESDVCHISEMNTTKLLSESGYEYTTFNGPRTQLISSPWEAVSERFQVELQNSAFPAATTSATPFSIENFQNNERLLVGGDPYTDGFYPEKIMAQSIAAWQDALEPDAAVQVTQEMGVKHLLSSETNPIFASLIKQLSLDLPTTDGEKAIQKNDSFSRWASKELGGVVDDLNMKSKIYWDEVDNVNIIDDSCLPPEDRHTYTMGPYLSQDQLFSIADIFPSWAFAGSEIIVFVHGSFLLNKDDIYKYKWSCMFGQEEVPAELVTDSILRCLTPTGVSGQVPFCVTYSNRFACSELREFEFRAHSEASFGSVDPYTLGTYEMLLYTRLDKMLSAGFSGNLDMIPSYSIEKANICNKITALLIVTNDELSLELKKSTDSDITVAEKPYDQLMQALLKEKLHAWLQYKVLEGGKGACILGKEGQGVIHLAAALGYNWAIAPLIAAGLNINFRDVRGWTALHWAAFCGRESTIVALLSLGAAPGALTDPTPEFPSGRPPADLASCNGHKGIGGFLAESSLTTHLSTLNLKDSGGKPGISTASTCTNFEKSSRNQFGGEDLQLEAHLSLKDSLAAVRNAAQAAARIYQVYRVHSFHRKKIDEFADDKFGMSDDHALSLFSVKANKSVPHDEPGHAAAVKIQKKFRGWKGRKDFLTMRQHVVKIQAHVRGYQVRKHFRKIVWSVGIVEKAILRWRRKGCGLRGFRSEAGLTEGTSMHVQLVKEDDYDFLREGRKQTEARFARALDRVKSMAQHPEARDQYRRLLTGIEDFQQSKVLLQRILYDEEPVDASMMLDIDELIGDDSFMTTG